MMDIDHFKEINDEYGHAAGDQVLQTMADVCRKTFRKVDTVGRYGGEEFLIILPETGASQALIAAERLRSRIAQADFETQNARLQVTVSLGIASLETSSSLEGMVDQADKAMYAAKQAGRNRTKVYSEL
jgi:diguanylate cyclase (GGDEF)-like protein